jgi:hypothetical protein
MKKFSALVAAFALTTAGIGLASVGISSAVEPITPTADPAPTVETKNISAVIVGTGTSGSTINIECAVQLLDPPPGEPSNIVTTGQLSFDEHGNPSTKSGELAPYWSAVGTSWVSVGAASTDLGTQTCSHTMANTGGATSTSWTCAYDAIPTALPGYGCAAAAGKGAGPVVLNWALATDELTSETIDMVFTNTYDAPIAPSFTG